MERLHLSKNLAALIVSLIQYKTTRKTYRVFESLYQKKTWSWPRCSTKIRPGKWIFETISPNATAEHWGSQAPAQPMKLKFQKKNWIPAHMHFIPSQASAPKVVQPLPPPLYIEHWYFMDFSPEVEQCLSHVPGRCIEYSALQLIVSWPRSFKWQPQINYIDDS